MHQTGADADAAPAKRTMVFVHGAGHGAWCWYQVVTLMQAAGFNAVTLDLTSGGVDKTAADNVKTISQYAKPLTDFLSDQSASDPKVCSSSHLLSPHGYYRYSSSMVVAGKNPMRKRHSGR